MAMEGEARHRTWRCAFMFCPAIESRMQAGIHVTVCLECVLFHELILPARLSQRTSRLTAINHKHDKREVRARIRCFRCFTGISAPLNFANQRRRAIGQWNNPFMHQNSKRAIDVSEGTTGKPDEIAAIIAAVNRAFRRIARS